MQNYSSLFLGEKLNAVKEPKTEKLNVLLEMLPVNLRFSNIASLAVPRHGKGVVSGTEQAPSKYLLTDGLTCC